MKLEEFQTLELRSASPVRIGPMGEETRTLLYGYDTDRRTYHVFQHQGELHLTIFTPGSDGPKIIDQKHDATLALTDIIPNKRVYPALSDFGFCLAIMNKGVSLPFTTFDPKQTLESRGGIAGTTGIDEIDDPATHLTFR
jgi:hypothetical protein